MENIIKFAEHFRLLARALRLIGKFPRPVLLAKAVSCFTASAQPFANLWFSAQVLTELAGDKSPQRLILLAFLAVFVNLGAMLLKSAAQSLSEYCSSGSHLWSMKTLTDKLAGMDFNKLERPDIQQEYAEINMHRMGMGYGTVKIFELYDEILNGITQIIIALFLCAGLFSARALPSSPVAFINSPLVEAAIILLFSAYIILCSYLSIKGGKFYAKTSNENNKGNRIFGFYFYEMIKSSSPAKDIRIYKQETIIKKQFNIDNSAVFEKCVAYDAFCKAAAKLISGLASGALYLLIALKAYGGAIEIGSVVLYIGAATQLCEGLSQLFGIIGTLVTNNFYLKRYFNFLDISNENYKGTLSVEKRADNDYEIEFKNVSFKYPQSENYALKNLNLKLRIGQKTAIVGMNGSGKTTMIKLLCRLYEPSDGIITLNGIDIKKYNYDEYMSIFSVVFQDFKLLPFTLQQNVAASVTPDKKLATLCLEKAGFGERLNSLPCGLKTYLYKSFDDKGIEVSGGEAQKIALARALYKNAPFIVLDEPTAALDPVAEYEIYTKFNEIVGEKTAIYISHRLSSCRFCDIIAVFDKGKLIQLGTHDKLLCDTNNKYYELWNAQAQYYKG